MWLLALVAAPCACTALLGIDEPVEDGGSTLAEAGIDGSVRDAGIDRSAHEAATDATRDQSVPPQEAGPAGFDASGVALIINPSQVSFASQTTPQTVSVSNIGTAASPPLTASLVGDTTDFQIVQSTCAQPLEVDASCAVTLGVEPTAAGQTSLLRVGGNGVFAYASVQGPLATANALVFSPLGCNFAPTEPGSVSAPCTLTLINDSGMTLPGFAWFFPSPFIEAEPTTCASLPVAGSCDFYVVFAPDEPSEAYSQTFSVTSGPYAASALLEGNSLAGDGSATGSSSSGGGSGSSSGGAPLVPTLTSLSGGAFTVWGVTSQDLVVASVQNGQPLVEGPLTNGATSTAIGVPGATAVRVLDDIIFAWEGDTLTLLAGGRPGQVVSTTSQASFAAAAYGDLAFFLDSVSGSTANLTEFNPIVPPFTNTVIAAITLPATPVAFDPCDPVAQATPSGFFLGACVGGNGPFAETVWAISTTGVITTIATAVSPVWGVDSVGAHVFVATPAGAGEVLDATGNVLATLDTGVTQGMMLPSGTGAVYVASGSLWTNTFPASTPTGLASGVAGLWGLSPTGNYAVFYDTLVGSLPPLGQSTDLLVVPTGGASAPARIGSSTVPAAPVTFSADETILAWATAGPGPSLQVSLATTALGNTVGVSPPIVTTPQYWPVAAGGTTLIYATTSGPGAVCSFDTSSDQATVLAAGVGPSFALAPGLDAVVYPGDGGVYWQGWP